MNVVPRRNTPLSPSAIVDAVRDAWIGLAGSAPSSDVLRALSALVLIETARGKSVQNNNLGNLSAGSSYGGNVWRPPWFDFDGGTNITDRNLHLHEEMLAGRAPSAFRAYSSPAEGARDFVRLLRGTSYQNVVSAAESGSADAFRRALAERYSKDYANQAATASFEQLFDEVSPFVGSSGSGVGGIVAGVLVAGVVAGGAWYFTRPSSASSSRRRAAA
jgi:hypothetical protein